MTASCPPMSRRRYMADCGQAPREERAGWGQGVSSDLERLGLRLQSNTEVSLYFCGSWVSMKAEAGHHLGARRLGSLGGGGRAAPPEPEGWILTGVTLVGSAIWQMSVGLCRPRLPHL